MAPWSSRPSGQVAGEEGEMDKGVKEGAETEDEGKAIREKG